MPAKDHDWLAQFIGKHTYFVGGSLLPLSEFADAFFDYLRPREPHAWTKPRLIRALNKIGSGFVYGVFNDNCRFIGNMSWTYRRSTLPAIFKRNGRLRRQRAKRM